MALPLVENLNLIIGKFCRQDDIIIDDLVFKIQRHLTVGILITFSIILSVNQYVGTNIDCHYNKIFKVSPDVVNAHCWVEGTVSNPFVSYSSHSRDHYDCQGKECWKHKYYQWVALVFVVQAGCFYLPRFLWQIFEDGKIKSFISGLEKSTDDDSIRQRLKDLVFAWRETKGTHRAWTWKYYFCELLNLLNVIGQFYFTNYFLGGHFHRIGINTLEMFYAKDSNEVNSILPITTSCHFEYHGSAGSPQSVNAFCVMPLNLLNEKFFAFFWILLCVILAMNIVNLLYRMITVVSKEVRFFKIRCLEESIEWERIKRMSHTDWFLLSMILQNMNGRTRTKFVEVLRETNLEDENTRKN